MIPSEFQNPGSIGATGTDTSGIDTCGTVDSAIGQALQALRAGRMVIVADDHDRENEGDLIMAAALVRDRDVNFMAREGRGLICAAIDCSTAQRLNLQVQDTGTALHGTAFTMSVDLIADCTSGISAADRARTLKALADPASVADDFARPGHVFPLLARPGGVLERRGHTEAACDLCALAGLPPAGILCEIVADDGTMARMDGLEERSRRWNMPLVTVQDLARYRLSQSPLKPHSAPVLLPRTGGELWISTWPIPGLPPESWPVVMARGINNKDEKDDPRLVPPLVRIHSECFTGETMGSLRCDCGPQLQKALDMVSREDRGAVIYLRQEGRGMGLGAKLQAYALQDQGLDTWDANTALGYPADGRNYRDAAWILHSLGWTSIRLLTNNPQKVTDLQNWGIVITQRIGLHTGFSPHNEAYRTSKVRRFGHYPAIGQVTNYTSSGTKPQGDHS